MLQSVLSGVQLDLEVQCFAPGSINTFYFTVLVYLHQSKSTVGMADRAVVSSKFSADDIGMYVWL